MRGPPLLLADSAILITWIVHGDLERSDAGRQFCSVGFRFSERTPLAWWPALGARVNEQIVPLSQLFEAPRMHEGGQSGQSCEGKGTPDVRHGGRAATAPGPRLPGWRRVSRRAIGYPVLVRPSYVFGGRAMEIVYDPTSLARYMNAAVRVSPAHSVLIDHFLEAAAEADVDAVSDGERVVIGGIMERIERAGVHSGDSACSLPPYSLAAHILAEIKEQTTCLALELGVVGLINIQFAVKNGDVYVLEVNPRASRTIPFVSKATGLNLAQAAVRVMVGKTLEAQGITAEPVPGYVSVKESVFPFAKFAGVDIVLGPEMRSTGEVMGIATDFAAAFAKSQLAANSQLPPGGTIFVSVAPRDRPAIVPIAARLAALGYDLVSTSGTAGALAAQGIHVATVRKIHEG